jgi:hypothetical protein
MSSATEQLECPFCDDGTIVETYLIGDGMPNVETRLESETRPCEFCNGDGTIPESNLPDEPATN